MFFFFFFYRIAKPLTQLTPHLLLLTGIYSQQLQAALLKFTDDPEFKMVMMKTNAKQAELFAKYGLQ